jgi:hypothetical protein
MSPPKIRIKNVHQDLIIERNRVLEEDYPVFCFKYLNEASIKECNNVKFFIEFLFRLKKLSELGWKEIRQSNRHSFGMEKIHVQQIHPQLPTCITPEVTHLHVFRATGSNLPFVGLEMQKIFRVFFIETKFGDIYDH